MALGFNVVVIACCSFNHKNRTILLENILIMPLVNFSRTDGFTQIADLLTSLVDVEMP